MMDAARAAGPMARALPLFYAVSAAGRAIVAAHGDDAWRGRSHGLAQGTMGDPITKTTIRPLPGGGLFQEVAQALHVPSLSGEVELGALWSAIPDLAGTPLEGPDWPRVLFVRPRIYDSRGTTLMLGAESKATVVLQDVIPVTAITEADYDWREFFEPYPAAEGLTLDSPPGVPLVTRMTERGWGMSVAWTDASPTERRTAIEQAPAHRFFQEHWLTPCVGSSDHLTPLALWWALLFGFSILARYEPTAWGAALDPDSSPLTVRIEDALEEALTAVPHLLLEGLIADQVLLPRPTPG
jgi:hypothetical protein